MQWLQKAKIIVVYSQDILLDDNTIYLSFFCPKLTQHTLSHCFLYITHIYALRLSSFWFSQNFYQYYFFCLLNVINTSCQELFSLKFKITNLILYFTGALYFSHTFYIIGVIFWNIILFIKKSLNLNKLMWHYTNAQCENDLDLYRYNHLALLCRKWNFLDIILK